MSAKDKAASQSEPSTGTAKQKSAETGTEYRYVGHHATEFQMEDGSSLQVGTGDFVTLSQSEYDSLDDEKAAYLIDTSQAQPTEEEVKALKESQANEANEGGSDDK